MFKSFIKSNKDIILMFCFVFIFIAIINVQVVNGDSMNPTLYNKDILLGEKISLYKHDINRGDIISFKTSLETNLGIPKILVKRVIGVENDHILIQNNVVYVNDIPLNEDYIGNNITYGDFDLVVPQDKLFVLGDNRDNSRDSRDPSVGLVNVSDVKTRVFVKIFSLGNLSDR